LHFVETGFGHRRRDWLRDRARILTFVQIGGDDAPGHS
jgi:hypothetical protein